MSKETNKETIDLSKLPDSAIIRQPDVLRLFPVSRATWWKGIRDGVYPKPIKLGERAVGWRIGDVLAMTAKSSTAK